MSKQLTTTYVEERILELLDEAWYDYCCGERTEFVLGMINAYVIMLEEILSAEGISDEALLDLEKHYGIR